MEEKGKQDSTANMMNVNENCMDIEIICRQEENVGDRLPYADEELITHFLDKKMIDQRFLDHTVHDVDFFLYHPQQLSQMYHPSQAKEWYFLSPSTQKYTEGSQCYSSNNDGYWEPCGADSLIHKDGKLIGYRKTLNYNEGKHEKDRKRTEWLMHEYRLDRSRDVRTGSTSDDMQWVFCKLFKSSDKFLVAEDKVVTKFAGPTDGVSSTDHTIQGPEEANDVMDHKGPSNGRSCDLQSLPETDQRTTTPYSSSKLLDQASKISSFDKPVTCSQHDQGTIVSTPKRQYVQRTTVTLSPPASDQGFMMPHLPNAKSQLTCDQGTRHSPPLPQNDQRTKPPTLIGSHKANSGMVTDKDPNESLSCDLHPQDVASSQGLVISRYSDKILDEPTGICSFDGTIANHELGTMLPSRPQHGKQKVPPEPQYNQQTMVPPLSGIHNVNNDEISAKPPTLNRHCVASDLPSSDQVPKRPLVEGSPRDSHENEAAVAPGYDGWLLYTTERLSPFNGPFESLTEEELAFFDKPDPEYPQAYEKKRPRNY
ncbi:putative protein isoform X2 [Capsicum chacoense]